ncbi:MAG: hypothetical protein ACREU2_10620 [Steroidobacteraceae bacterium]
MTNASDRNQGEGNREAAKRFNEAEKRFVESPQGEQKIREGVHVKPEQERELSEAERSAKARAKAQDSGSWPEPTDKR